MQGNKQQNKMFVYILHINCGKCSAIKCSICFQELGKVNPGFENDVGHIDRQQKSNGVSTVTGQAEKVRPLSLF